MQPTDDTHFGGQDYILLDEYSTRRPTPSEPMKFDFDQFHPLMHRAFSRECFGWYGGPTQHLKLWWDYARPHPIGSLLCRVGRHQPSPYWRGRFRPSELTEENAAGTMCARHCGWRKT